MTANPNTTPVTEVVLTRLLDAPRERVFRAWIDSGMLARWWGPRGFTNPVCEIDARPGGAIRIDMTAPDGTVSPMKGTFLEVVEPERLVFTATALEDEDGNPQLETHNTVTFEDVGGKTKLTLCAVVTKATAAAQEALGGMEQGWSETLDGLAEELGATA